MNLNDLYKKALDLDTLTTDEGLFLYEKAPGEELMFVGNMVRQIHNPGNKVGWIIDRNINITNVCFSQCLFCNFCRKKNSPDAYITSRAEYIKKIDELFALGGDQVLLQGGMHPDLGLDYYTSLFRELKELYPGLKLHALGPPEVIHLSRKERISTGEVLSRLISAGLDSLPGAGAEILSDRVRKIVSPGKASTREWSEVMTEAHKLNLPTSATMMYGHVETNRERIEHLVRIREIQDLKPSGNYGFITFIPWPFMDKGTRLTDKTGTESSYSAPDYIRLIALSRIMLNNVRNIQASILTTGRVTGMLSLHSGANDLGSVMIEENVLSSAGSPYRFSPDELCTVISEAGFNPVRRNQKYEYYE
ncbi:MAG: radical SAM protein [Bacteroidales bacterium]